MFRGLFPRNNWNPKELQVSPKPTFCIYDSDDSDDATKDKTEKKDTFEKTSKELPILQSVKHLTEISSVLRYEQNRETLSCDQDSAQTKRQKPSACSIISNGQMKTNLK